MKKIKQRQNERELLEIQYAARVCFNHAEKVGWYIWILAAVAELCVFLPNSLHVGLLWGIPVVLNIVVGVLSQIHKKSIENGASLRNYFDAYVLNLSFSDIDDTSRRATRALAFRITQKRTREAEIQIKNTGRDVPPGVKDWYEFNSQFEENAAICECQKQNRWWTNEMLKGCIKERLIVASVVITVFACMLFFLPDSRWNTAICSVGLIFRAVERLVAYWRFYIVSNGIDAIIQNLDNGYRISNLLELQKRFERLRMLPVVGSNRIHKKYAQKLSTDYNRITQ